MDEDGHCRDVSPFRNEVDDDVLDAACTDWDTGRFRFAGARGEGIGNREDIYLRTPMRTRLGRVIGRQDLPARVTSNTVAREGSPSTGAGALCAHRGSIGKRQGDRGDSGDVSGCRPTASSSVLYLEVSRTPFTDKGVDMPGPVTTTFIDRSLEQHAMRQHGLLGRGGGMGNALYAIDYDSLPAEARRTIDLIISDGPFPHPGKDGSPFGNRFGDLPGGRYLEYTVPTPGATNRGARRIVARLSTAQIFFTACHYERVQVAGGTATERTQARLTATACEDSEWRNGFYLVTGLVPDLRAKISLAIKARS